MGSPVLGIDLGTTNTVVAAFDAGKPRVLSDEAGGRLTPSVVSFHPSGKVLVGKSGRDRRLLDAGHTIFSTKRLLGRPFRSPEVQRAAESLPFTLGEGRGGGVVVQARGETYSLAEISALVLRHARGLAEKALGVPCGNAVITVPANFNELQRTATRDAGRIAGLSVLRILNEPTAAALAYGYTARTAERIAIYDLGGGTFDISILDLSGDVIEVIATSGDSYLGGDDVDTAVSGVMAQAFLKRHQVDLSSDRQAYERLRLAAEWLKCQLSKAPRASCRVEEVAYGKLGKAMDLDFTLTREELDRLSFPIIGRTFDICEEALRIAGVRPAQLDNVLLVGGQTASPLVREMVADYFGRQPLATVDPSEAVAKGAAILGHTVSGGVYRTSRPRSTRPPPAMDEVTRVAVDFDDEPTRVAQPTRPSGPDLVTSESSVSVQPPPSPVSAPIVAAPPIAPPPVAPPPVAPPPIAPPPAAAPPGPSFSTSTNPAHPIGASPNVAGSSTLLGVGGRHAKAAPSGGSDPARDDPRRTAPSRPSKLRGQRQGLEATASLESADPNVTLRSATSGPPLAAVSVPDPLSSPTTPTPAAAKPGDAAVPLLSSNAPVTSRAAAGAKARLRAPPVPAEAHTVGAEAEGQRADRTELGLPPPVFAPDAPPPLSGPPPASEPAVDVEVPSEPTPEPRKRVDTRPERPSRRSSPTPERPASAPASEQARDKRPRTPGSQSIPAPDRGRVAPLLLDVTPHSLSVETAGGYCEQIIERNAAIPTEQTRRFSTSQDNQSLVRIRVCQGEERRVDDNQQLGAVELSGLRRAPRGAVKIDVTFIIDADGTLDVKARDEATGKAQAIRIDLVGALSDADVEQMRKRQSEMEI